MIDLPHCTAFITCSSGAGTTRHGVHVPPTFPNGWARGHRGRTFNYDNPLWYANYKCQKWRM